MKRIAVSLFALALLIHSTGHAAPPPSTELGWKKILDTPATLTGTTTNDEEVYSLFEYRGLLYIGYYTAGLPNWKRAARLYTWDGKTQTLKYTFGTGLSFASVQALGEYKGDLYAAMSGLNAGDGDIYVSKDGGSSWTKSYNTTADHFCSALVVFKDKLYAGMGYMTSRIAAFDGTTWKVVYPGKTGSGLVEWMIVFRGKLYAALGGPQAGRAHIVSTEDGVTWTVDQEFGLTAAAYFEAASMAEFKGRLYVGILKTGTSGGDVLVLDNATGKWSVAWSNPNGNRVHALASYNGRLYAGNANAVGAGDVYVSDDGVTFSKDLDTPMREVFRLYAYNGSLYMGTGFNNAQAQIWRKNDSVALRQALRQVWESYASAEAAYVGAAVTMLDVPTAVEDRWLTAIDDVGASLTPFYSNVGQTLVQLLREREGLTKEVIQMAKTDPASKTLASKFNDNNEAIAAYLSGLNEHFNRDEIKDLLAKHAQYLTAQITAALNANPTEAVSSYDLERFYVLKLADQLSEGILNQVNP